MKYTISFSKGFQKSFDKLKRSGKFSENEVRTVIKILASGEKLPVNYRDHPLLGNWKGYRECHIQGDLLLIYKIQNNELILTLVEIGSHSQLFG